jgi:hypothetical protein
MFTTTKTRQRRQPESFRCLLECGKDTYAVTPLRDVHPEVAKVAYRLRKRTGARDVYDVRLTTEGWAECDCRGHQAHGHCKHVKMLVSLGLLPTTASKPVVEPVEPPVEKPVVRPAAQQFRSLGDMARNAPEMYEREFGCPDGDWQGYPSDEPFTEADQQAMAAYFGQD